MIICECGEIIEGSTFKDYIKTPAGPSTPTIGHKKCGRIFNFINDKMPKKYSSRKELKSLAMRFVEKSNFDAENIGRYLMEVDRLKSSGNMSDRDILITAIQMLQGTRKTLACCGFRIIDVG
jgi:hypothetical protein